MVKISDYLSRENITFLEVDSREEVLEKLVDLLHKNGNILEHETFYSAVCEREKIVSTGIGMGVAIPHAKLSTYDHFFIAMGILRKGVNWDSIDDSPVRLVFLIGGPDDKQTEYLKILSSVTQAVKDEDRRKKVLNLGYVEEIFRLFRE